MAFYPGTPAGETIDGTNDADEIHGQGGNDILNGLGGPDFLFGEAGDDVLEGGHHGDYMDGGTGIDTVSYSTSPDRAHVRLSDGLASGNHAGNDIFVSIENLIGSTFEDYLTGSALANIIDGGKGHDYLYGLVGNDTLLGGDGNDRLTGGSGADVLNGGAGADWAYYNDSGAINVNLLTNISTGSFANGDTFFSIEKVWGSIFGDTIAGDDNANQLDGDAGDDAVRGNGGNDVLWGGDGNDTLEGGNGDDRLIGGNGGDVLNGGAGNDTAVYQGASVQASLYGGFGSQAAGDSFVSVENLEGSNFGDSLTGNNLSNVLTGGGGNDAINGSTGDDFVHGGAGDDELVGAAGADLLDGGDGIDWAFYSTSSAVAVNLATGAASGGDAAGDSFVSIEAVFGSKFADTLTGDLLANDLFGAEGDDTLNGGAGADALDGWDGDDTLNGGIGNDVLVGGIGADALNGGDGDDTLVGGGGADVLNGGAGNDAADYSGSTSKIVLNMITGIGVGDAAADTFVSIESIVGTNFDDELTGSTGANILNGGKGNDFINGSLGDDVLNGGIGNDTLVGGGGADAFDGGDGIDTVTYQFASRGVIVGAASADGNDGQGDTMNLVEIVIGSAFADRIVGDSHRNTILGGASDDTLEGGVHEDVIEGGAGADTMSGGNDGWYDTLSYASSNAGVTVDYFTGKGSGGHAEGDVFSQFENVIGSDFDDVITWPGLGDGGSVSFYENRIQAGAGDDIVRTGNVFASMFYQGDYDGGAGYDTLDASIATSGLQGLDLALSRMTGFEAVIGSGFGDIIAGGAIGEIISAGGGNDEILGRGGDDRLDGGEGNDELTGGLGADVFAFSDTKFGQDRIEDFDDGVDQIALTGSGHSFADFTETQNGADVLLTLTADPTQTIRIVGANVADIDGSDFAGIVIDDNDSGNSLVGTSGSDTINGNGGDDTVVGAAGADTLDGGEGFDTLSYETSSAAVDVNLLTGAASGGDAKGDVFFSFEGIVGSDFADILTGNTQQHRIDAGSGNDTINAGDGLTSIWHGTEFYGPNVLTGGDGDDTIVGASGDDIAIGGVGADTMTGGSGYDVLSYATSSAGVSVDLVSAAASGSDAEGDVISGFEGLVGSAFDDVLSYAGSSNKFWATSLDAGDGDDTVIVAGDLTASDGGFYQGGSGADTLDASAAPYVYVSLGSRFNGFERVIGSSSEDQIAGDSQANAIEGAGGDDFLAGGGGADRFVYANASFGVDRISDYLDGTDKFDLTGSGLTFADFTEIQDGADVLLTLTADPTNSIRLVTESIANIDGSDFTV